MLIHRLALIVDDDANLRQFMRVVLERDGFQVLEAEGGTPALSLVQTLYGELDVIVTDIQMPDGDGVTFASEVRRRFPRIPILLVSGRPYMDVGFSYLEKPFSSVTLSAWVRRLLGPQAKSA